MREDTIQSRQWDPRTGRHRSGRVFPLLLMIAGALLLLNNFGIVPWSLWPALAQLWPVFLILFGIDLVIGPRARRLAILISVVGILGVVAVAGVMTYTGTSPAESARPTPKQLTTVPLAGATSANIVLHFPVGTLSVGALGDSGKALVNATTTMPANFGLTRTNSTDNGVAQVTLGTENKSPGPLPFNGNNPGGPFDWNVQLAPNLPLTLNTDVGAGQANFDLTNLAISNFTLNNGAGESTIRLPTNASQTVVDVHSGAGQVVLIVPPDVGAQVHVNRGIGSVNVPSDRFTPTADGYQSVNYATATNKVDVTLNVGVGTVDVQ